MNTTERTAAFGQIADERSVERDRLNGKVSIGSGDESSFRDDPGFANRVERTFGESHAANFDEGLVTAETARSPADKDVGFSVHYAAAVSRILSYSNFPAISSVGWIEIMSDFVVGVWLFSAMLVSGTSGFVSGK